MKSNLNHMEDRIEEVEFMPVPPAMEINPIIQRCVTVTQDHHFVQMFNNVQDWENGEVTYVKMPLISGRTGGKLYMCQACKLVDDIYEGRFK